MATQVARRIAAARTACGVSQEVLAERLGMATRNLQRIEGGRQN
ncbi:MAG: helix-turn-helix domain-containing protein, partial [Deltaproteobacteria bacterium]|nr:helix-turn-helix domain-containing protein [Deltaproteobacteria bacterium]